MKRRTFLETTAALGATSLLPKSLVGSKDGMLDNIGIQLFSLPNLLEKDFRGAISMLANMGYNDIEMYGPFPFSAASAKERWKAIVPMVGFSGSGYFGHSAKEVKSIFTEFGMKTSAIHVDLETMQTRMEYLGEAGDQLGFTYVGLPAIPEEKRRNLDDYKIIADEFNKIGEAARKAGLRFAYHNHGYGLQEVDGQIPVQLILDGTDPDLVFFELDIYWTTAGGADPVEYLEAYPGRYHLMHLKDMKELVRFSGDGGDPGEWIELFPYMTTAGDGVLDLHSIVSSAKASGVKHFFVEQDMVDKPGTALQRSIDYLREL